MADFNSITSVGAATPTDRTANEVLQLAMDRLESAGKERDTPGGERSMARAVSLFNKLNDRDLTEAEGWAMMVCLKLSRSVQGRFVADDYCDLAGYIALLAECCSK
jgi:Domain of unknown function (DUF6378)